MEKKMVEKFNNEDLLRDICDVYGYDVVYKGDSILLMSDEGLESTYKNIELALVDWLDTLIESELEYRKDNVDATWIEEINYIKDIKTRVLFDENFKGLEEHLTYGEIPNSIRKELSVFLKERTERTDKFIKLSKKTNTKTLKASLPVEFIIQEDELKYIKITNKSYLERLIFEGDTSEIEFYEKDTYTKDGLIENMPLLPINKLSKFELNIPVALTITNNTLRIHNPINYLHLF